MKMPKIKLNYKTHPKKIMKYKKNITDINS